MPNLQPITLSRYRDWRWQRYSNYRFAKTDALVPLVAQELPKAVMSLPIGFVKQQDAYALVAVLNAQPGTNLFVGADGRWLGSYVPAAYRSYPFALANTDDGQQVLCFDEDSGLLLQDAPSDDGEPFFDVYEEPAKPVRDVLQFLQQVEANRRHTAALCERLAEHALIQRWPLKLQTTDGERAVEGLFRVDEAALNALDAEGFDALRQAGALPLIYCQLLSMQHIALLGKLAAAHANAQPKLEARELFGEQETLSFDWD